MMPKLEQRMLQGLRELRRANLELLKEEAVLKHLKLDAAIQVRQFLIRDSCKLMSMHCR